MQTLKLIGLLFAVAFLTTCLMLTGCGSSKERTIETTCSDSVEYIRIVETEIVEVEVPAEPIIHIYECKGKNKKRKCELVEIK